MKSYNCKDIWRFYKLNGGKLDYNTFKLIVSESNKKNSNLIINNGYHYELPHFCGIIKIIRYDRHIKVNEAGNIDGAVNWGESLKLKKKIIEDGDIPYETVKDEKGKVVSNNGGVKWLVYHIDNFFYMWCCLLVPLLHNSETLEFTPTWHNARALIAAINEDSEFLYKENVGNNGTGRNNFLKACFAKNGVDIRN